MRKPGGVAATSMIAAAASLMLAGCVSLPSSGTVRGVESASPDQGLVNQIAVVPRSPGPQWSPNQVVEGFIAASGAEAGSDSLLVAREFLTAAYQRQWLRHSKPNVNVIDTGSGPPPPPRVPHITNEQSSPIQVTVSSSHLSNLVDGRLQGQSGATSYVFTFTLKVEDNEWRIKSITLPDGKASKSILLLWKSDFQSDYQPRDLYYPASHTSTRLVPSPVYIPDNAPLLGVQQLVSELIAPLPKTSWLYPAVATAFPRGTSASVQVQDTQAVIDLRGKAVRAAAADPPRLRQMSAQLLWTLTHSPSSAGTGILSVQLRIGKKSVPLDQLDFPNSVPQSPGATESLYFQALDPTGRPVLEAFKAGSTTFAQAPRPQSLPPAPGRGMFDAIAVSPGATYFAGCRGKVIYVTELVPGPLYSRSYSQSLPSACTSVTWIDGSDFLVAAGAILDEVTPVPTGLHVIPVSVPPRISGATFTSLEVAPDGLRVAMIVRSKEGASVYVAAISGGVSLAENNQLLPFGPDVANPVAVSWWDSDHLLVLGKGGLHVVPLDGEPSVPVPTPLGTVSVTSNGSVIAIGTGGPGGQTHVDVSHVPDGLWKAVVWQKVAKDGTTPVYPG